MFTKSEDGIITFTDTSKITYEQWSLMLKKLNYVGYDFEDTDQVKEYFDRHRPLNKDQSDIVISVLKKKPIGYRMTSRKKESYLRRSVEHFGTTTRWEKAGYVLTNGLMLNFAGECPRRVFDHRDIKEIVTHPQMIGQFSENTCAMIEFINYGHIRCRTDGFETATRLTPDQKQTIRDYMDFDGSIFIDVMNPNGNVARHFEYYSWCPERMFNDINRYFDDIGL